jgi:hypothetical protein
VLTLRDSPARQEISNRLIAGDSVVWVLLTSGDARADDAAYGLLSSRLAELRTTLRLPEIAEADFGDLSVVPDALRMSFSVLRIARDDPRESQFITMLLHAGGGTAADRALAIPIFGRGRAFDALGGEQLNHQTIEDACRFLTGACQCTVKAQNPGLDLLMAVDWDGRIQPAILADAVSPPLTGLSGFSPTVETSLDGVLKKAPAEIDPGSTGTRFPTSDADSGSNNESAFRNGTRAKDAEISLQGTSLFVLVPLCVAVALATLFVYVRGK